MNLTLGEIQVAKKLMDEAEINYGPSIYLAGPMSGYPQLNREAFEETAEALREGGWSVFSPLEHDIEKWGEGWINANDGSKESLEKAKKEYSFDLRSALGTDLRYICLYADAIFMLKGWEKSLGARAEHATATALGLEIIYQ
jgi:hypothetical protein